MTEKTKSSSAPQKRKSVTFLESTIWFILKLIVMSLFAWILLSAWFIWHSPNLAILTVLFDTFSILLNRLHLLILAIPCLLIFLFLAVADGLVQRAIRTYQGARESTFLFHRMKHFAGFSFCILFLAYMATPWVLSPKLLLFPMLFVSLAIKYFKKYL